MNRKDVTPNETNVQKTSWIKKFGTSLVGGLVGGALVMGGYYMIYTPSTSTSDTSQSNNQKTPVSNVNLKVNSDVTKAVKKMSPAVVSITTLKKQNQNISGLESIFGPSDNNNSELQELSQGSGVIYQKKDGKAYIVTNNHVIDGADAVEVLLNTGEKVSAKVVGADTFSDLAVLEIDAKYVTAVAEFANSDKVQVGEPALAMGSPLGSSFANSVSQGIVSAVNRNISNQTENGDLISTNAIQTDAAINPGNSGGPLVNITGQIIGINSSKIAQATAGVSAEGMGFAIPSNDVVSIIEQLEKNGKVARPMLGITMVDLSQVSAFDRENTLKLKDDNINSGVVVGRITKNSPAEKAGFKRYDIIVKMDGKDVPSTADLQSILYSKKIGDNLKVEVVRGNKRQTLTVHLDQDSSKLQQNQQENDE